MFNALHRSIATSVGALRSSNAKPAQLSLIHI